MSKRYSPYDPFILAQKARQVYFVPYPETCKDMRGWSMAITTKPRGHVEVDDTENEVPYQADEMSCVLPITEVEALPGLLDINIGHYEQLIDPINEPMVQDNKEEDEEDISTEHSNDEELEDGDDGEDGEEEEDREDEHHDED